MNVFKAPQKFPRDYTTSVFLAGSIEMGNAVDWQTLVTESLKDRKVNILNPRRNDWDSSWRQEASNPQFSEQVNWELDALDHADIILMYFDPATKSPISLLELGLYAKSTKLIVVCPEGFWRKGNVDIVCQRNKIIQVSTLEEAVRSINQSIDILEDFDRFDEH